MNELYHHGILGQKWGVRRYQNKDGTRIKSAKTKKRIQIKKPTTRQVYNAAAMAMIGYSVYNMISGRMAKASSKQIPDYRNYTNPRIDKGMLGAIKIATGNPYTISPDLMREVGHIVTRVTEDGIPIDELY